MVDSITLARLFDVPYTAVSGVNCQPNGNLMTILSPSVRPPVVVTRNSIQVNSPFYLFSYVGLMNAGWAMPETLNVGLSDVYH